MNIEEEISKFDLVELEFDSTYESAWWIEVKDSSAGEGFCFTSDDCGETAEEAFLNTIHSLAKGLNRIKYLVER